MTTTKLRITKHYAGLGPRRFLDMDPKLLFRRVPELTPEGAYLTLRHFGKKYGLRKRQEKSSIWSRPRRRL